MTGPEVRECLTIMLLTATWVLLTLGIATTDWPLTIAAVPSLAAATVLHVAGLKR